MKNWVDKGMYDWLGGVLRRSGFRKLRDHKSWRMYGEATWIKPGAPFWFRIDVDSALTARRDGNSRNTEFSLLLFRAGPASPPEASVRVIGHIDFHREIVAAHSGTMGWTEFKIHHTEVVRLIRAVADKSHAPALAGIEWAIPLMEELLK